MIQPRAIILCEDIREEVGGKHTIVGMHGNRLQVSTRPAIIALKLLTNLTIDSTGSDVEIEVTFNRTNVHKASVPGGFTNFNGILPLTILMVEEKPLVVRIRESGAEWSAPWIWDFSFDENAVELPENEAAEIRRHVAAMPKEVVKTMERQEQMER